MSPESHLHSRRSFLQGTAILAGLKVLRVEIPAALGAQVVANKIQNTTDWEGAETSPDPEATPRQIEANALSEALTDSEAYTGPTLGESINTVVIAPVLEEAAFRALPSFVLSKFTGHHHNHTEKFIGLSKPELATGVASSTIFAASHIPRNRHLSRNPFPAAQFVSGMFFWRLQRKTGYQSNVAAHSGHNAVAVGVLKAISIIKRS